MSELKDSGVRQEFATGAVRDSADGKPRLDLIPGWAMLAWGWIMDAGAVKYTKKDSAGKVIESGERNWEKGMPLSRYVASAKRHLELYQMGFRDEPHLWQALWNVGGAIHTSVMVYIGKYPKEFYDLPSHVPGELQMFSEFEKTRIDAMLASSKDAKPMRPEDVDSKRGTPLPYRTA